MPDVSLVAALVATVAGFALGALWYGPLFGRWWMSAVGLSPEMLQRDFSPGRVYGATFVLGFVASYVLGLYLGRNPGLSFAIVTGAGAGLFFVATSLATNYLFERRSAALMLINGGYHVVRLALSGLVFGIMG